MSNLWFSFGKLLPGPKLLASWYCRTTSKTDSGDCSCYIQGTNPDMLRVAADFNMEQENLSSKNEDVLSWDINDIKLPKVGGSNIMLILHKHKLLFFHINFCRNHSLSLATIINAAFIGIIPYTTICISRWQHQADLTLPWKLSGVGPTVFR